jgi:hypothetical protein
MATGNHSQSFGFCEAHQFYNFCGTRRLGDCPGHDTIHGVLFTRVSFAVDLRCSNDRFKPYR